MTTDGFPGAFALSFAVIFVAEGSTVGMVAADALAIDLGRRPPERVIALGAAALFAIFGIWLIVEAFAQLS